MGAGVRGQQGADQHETGKTHAGSTEQIADQGRIERSQAQHRLQAQFIAYHCFLDGAQQRPGIQCALDGTPQPTVRQGKLQGAGQKIADQHHQNAPNQAKQGAGSQAKQ